MLPRRSRQKVKIKQSYPIKNGKMQPSNYGVKHGKRNRIDSNVSKHVVIIVPRMSRGHYSVHGGIRNYCIMINLTDWQRRRANRGGFV